MNIRDVTWMISHICIQQIHFQYSSLVFLFPFFLFAETRPQSLLWSAYFLLLNIWRQDQNIRCFLIPDRQFSQTTSDAPALAAPAISCLLESILGFHCFFLLLLPFIFVYCIYYLSLSSRRSWAQKAAKKSKSMPTLLSTLPPYLPCLLSIVLQVLGMLLPFSYFPRFVL